MSQICFFKLHAFSCLTLIEIYLVLIKMIWIIAKNKKNNWFNFHCILMWFILSLNNLVFSFNSKCQIYIWVSNLNLFDQVEVEKNFSKQQFILLCCLTRLRFYSQRIFQAQLAGAVEYTEIHLCRDKCHEYDTKLIVRLQSWRFGICGEPLYCHYSHVHSDLEW